MCVGLLVSEQVDVLNAHVWDELRSWFLPFITAPNCVTIITCLLGCYCNSKLNEKEQEGRDLCSYPVSAINQLALPFEVKQTNKAFKDQLAHWSLQELSKLWSLWVSLIFSPLWLIKVINVELLCLRFPGELMFLQKTRHPYYQPTSSSQVKQPDLWSSLHSVLIQQAKCKDAPVIAPLWYRSPSRNQ